ncbi:MAG TPA: primosomal protein N' [Anaerolineales bacterium]|nr:primosomal protein N' [Anaerolineales bacterium]
MTSFVRVAVNVPSLAGVFDYAVPGGMAVQSGQLVLVPFGSKTAQAVVLECIDQPSLARIKEISAVLDTEPVLTAAQIRFAESLAVSTLAPLASVVSLFLPPGLGQQVDTSYSLAEGRSTNAVLGDLQERLIALLDERGPLRGRQIDRVMQRADWRRAAQSLVKRGVLSAESVLSPVRVRPKYVRTAQLAVAPESAELALPHLGMRNAQARRASALRYLMKHPESVNVSWVYAETGCNLADLQELAEQQLIILQETQIWRDPVARAEEHPAARGAVIFSDEQQAVWNEFQAALDQAASGETQKPFLLQGVTGSGKTELYIRAACHAVDLGRQAIVLVPEIALTPQTVQRFLERFPGQTGLVHSRLSEGERYDTWRRARSGQLKVIIGPRSALFAPLPEVGLIVVDECHDASYYQSEPPFYNAAAAVQAYARICGAVCILGSATPGVVQRYEAEVGHTRRVELQHRVGASGQSSPARELDLPSVHIVDMREELKAGNRGILSRALQDALGNVLERGEQAILFMNRRGSATYVFCRACGSTMRCPRCDTPLTYHLSAGEMLLCHRCGFTGPMPRTCPECGSPSMRAYGLGTEKVEADVQRLFPRARTLRWDRETTRQKDAHEIILGHFAAGRADVLIGTQMLAKGLDLPRVTLVGMVLADVGLFLPDPFAAERVFQVLTQVAGRAGRSSLGGEAVLQTFEPDHYAIQAAASHDVNGFYMAEAAQRRRLGFPPFSNLFRLEIRDPDANRAERAAAALAARLRNRIHAERRESVSILGPAPCFYARLGGQYRWQVVLRGADLQELLPKDLGRTWRIETEPVSLL